MLKYFHYFWLVEKPSYKWISQIYCVFEFISDKSLWVPYSKLFVLLEQIKRYSLNLTTIDNCNFMSYKRNCHIWSYVCLGEYGSRDGLWKLSRTIVAQFQVEKKKFLASYEIVYTFFSCCPTYRSSSRIFKYAFHKI